MRFGNESEKVQHVAQISEPNVRHAGQTAGKVSPSGDISEHDTVMRGGA